MRKKIIIIAAIPIVLVLLLELVLYTQSGGVKTKIEKYSQENLEGEVQLSSVRLSILKSFPRLSAWVQEPMVISGQDTLLNVSTLGIKISWWSLLSSTVQVKSVVIRDGVVNLNRTKAGKWNFDILKKSEGEVEEGETSGLSINKAELSNVRLVLRDELQDLNAEVMIEKTTLAGSFNTESLSLSVDNSMKIKEYVRNKRRIIHNLPFKVRLDMERSAEGLDLGDIIVFLGKSELTGSGKLVEEKGGQRWSVDLEGSEISIDQVLDLLGQDGEAFGSGKIDMKVRGSGLVPEKGVSTYDLEFSLANGQLKSGILKSGIKDISCQGSFVSDGKKEVLVIKDLKADNRGEKIAGDLKVVGFEKPDVEASFSGKVPVGWITASSKPYMTGGKGDVSFRNVKLKSSSSKNTFSGSGDIVFEDPDFMIMDSPFSADNLELNLVGGDVKAKGGGIEFLGCDLNAEGRIVGIPAMMASKGFMEFDFVVTGSGLVIDDVLKQVEIFNNSLPESETTSDLQFKGRYKLELEDIKYGDLVIDMADIDVKTAPSLITWAGTAKSVDGEWKLDQSLHSWPSGGYTLRGLAECKGTDIRKLFLQLKDFGQEFLTHQHISGQMESKAIMDVTWDANNEVVPEKIQVCMGTRLSKGALKNFPMMENFASFVKVEDLRNIQFAELINIIEIKDGRVFLPSMFIQSNAMNMDVSGEHSLEHDILYHIKVNAGQILTRRFESHDARLVPVKAETNGWFNLFYQISGTVDNFTYQTNKREVKNHFEQMTTMYKAGVGKLESKFGPIAWIRAPREWSEVQMFDMKNKGEEVKFLDDF